MVLAMVAAGGSLGRAQDGQSRGAMSVIFLQNGGNQTSSSYFHVSKENGLVRWRNYEDTQQPEWGGQSRVYELKKEDVPADPPTLSEDERAERWLAKGLSLKVDR